MPANFISDMSWMCEFHTPSETNVTNKNTLSDVWNVTFAYLSSKPAKPMETSRTSRL